MGKHQNLFPWIKKLTMLIVAVLGIGIFSLIGWATYLFGAVALDNIGEDETVMVTTIVFFVTGSAVWSLNTIMIKLVSKAMGISESKDEASERIKFSMGMVYALPIIAFTLGFFRAELAPIWSVEARAAAYYRTNAKAGNADAQYKLGDSYSNGRGLFRSKSTAIHWWQKAAAQGHAKAQGNLGYAYANGVGVGENYREAAHWYSLSAKQGNPYSLNQLGTLYRDGKGVAKSYTKAIKFFTRGAFQGDAWSIASLAYMHEVGLGVPKSRKNAIEFYRLSASKNNLYAKKSLQRLKAAKENKNSIIKGLRSSITAEE